jgi:predicted ribosomally synthesized peptide with SipW-like signal peptide
MSDQPIELTRRKALAALGTVGVASAGAGLGTTAYFNDTENFANNQLTAGSLDLKVDWEEHYSDWSDDEGNLDDDDASNDLDIRMSDPGSTNYTPLPDPANPMIWVADDDLGAFMDNTSVEAYPDTDGSNDGVQDSFGENGVGDFCTAGADNPSDLDPANSLRSNNDDTVDDDGNAKPIISIDDVKPGDFGELTLSFHLCDNPGYVWLNGRPVTAAENGVTEPEADSDDSGPTDESYDVKNGDSAQDILDSEVELLDEIQTTWWYDDGDNVFQMGGGGQATQDVDVVLVLDESGSISSSEFDAIQSAAKDFVDLLDTMDQSASVGFASSASVQQSLTTNKQDVKDAIDGTQSGGSTNIQEAINTAQGELDSNGRTNADPFIVLLSDGAPTTSTTAPDPDDSDIPDDVEAALEAADDAKSAGTRIVTLGFGIGTAGANVLRSIAGTTANSETTYANGTYDDEGDYFAAPTESDLQTAFGQIGQVVAGGEELIFRGSLRESLTALSNGNGIPLDGDRSTAFNEVGGADDDSNRECFTPTPDTHYIGFAWYLPAEVGNEVQTDSVSFDIGFYTEQCRHNDGSGQAAESSS